MNARAAIFDLDGTLVDALPDIRANVNMALQELGYDFQLSSDQTRPHVGGGAQKLAASVLGKAMDDPETMALYHRFTQIYVQHPADFGRPFPGVMETLQTLNHAGVKLACVTAKPTVARIKVLEILDIIPLFSHALSPEDGYAKKPAPDMLLACCEVMGVPTNETIMVGDTRFDLEAGIAAGCHTTVHISHGYQPLPEDLRDQVTAIDHFSQLLPTFGLPHSE
ncbi:MAG: HAD-IA family hydrolase [Mariprofundales bacterium]|nr:HAD-IA family hydrolase [Mariprofundales bacterium]